MINTPASPPAATPQQITEQATEAAMANDTILLTVLRQTGTQPRELEMAELAAALHDSATDDDMDGEGLLVCCWMLADALLRLSTAAVTR